MPTDDERREAARRLRRAWANVPDRNPVRHHMRVLYEIYAAVGLNDDGADAIDLFDLLADLIWPDTTADTTKTPADTTKCDRDALLALADEMETADPEDLDVAIDYVTECASRIRDALGVSDD